MGASQDSGDGSGSGNKYDPTQLVGSIIDGLFGGGGKAKPKPAPEIPPPAPMQPAGALPGAPQPQMLPAMQYYMSLAQMLRPGPMMPPPQTPPQGGGMG